MIMKTPGYIKVQISLLIILATSSVLSTGLQIYKLGESTSGENTFGQSVNPREVRDVLQKSLTGSGITEALIDLNQTLKNMVSKTFPEKS